MNKPDECDHNYEPWVYRDIDNSMWDVMACVQCESVLSNVKNHELDYIDYAPGWNRDGTQT